MEAGAVPDPAALTERLVPAGETITRQTRFTREDIASFSRASLDENPLHLDAGAARRAGFADIIASGQQTAAMMMGLLATHYSRDAADGTPRDMLCLNMNLAFKEPVLAGQQLTLHWAVASVEWKEKLQGVLVHLDGSVTVASPAEPAGAPPVALIARGTILVKQANAPIPAAAEAASEETAELRS